MQAAQWPSDWLLFPSSLGERTFVGDRFRLIEVTISSPFLSTSVDFLSLLAFGSRYAVTGDEPKEEYYFCIRLIDLWQNDLLGEHTFANNKPPGG